MGKIYVCDFCDRRDVGIKLRYRVKERYYIPGVFGPDVSKLQLCHECYKRMKDYIKNKTTPKAKEND